ncbi:hypothetical protein HMPREF9370_0161 [Neisseria wadsworthii 9715]|uniref:Uncharacterized protein n=1 Tax=Neisseria wadsworthii 9715 TaxID=1030841 RepID=G4CM52_9NEIS|nr:hypothetical protein HMPREF9370_0161 [Neisseria wadsworthii 9715]
MAVNDKECLSENFFRQAFVCGQYGIVNQLENSKLVILGLDPSIS